MKCYKLGATGGKQVAPPSTKHKRNCKGWWFLDTKTALRTYAPEGNGDWYETHVDVYYCPGCGVKLRVP